jgi:hypothetical protein
MFSFSLHTTLQILRPQQICVRGQSLGRSMFAQQYCVVPSQSLEPVAALSTLGPSPPGLDTLDSPSVCWYGKLPPQRLTREDAENSPMAQIREASVTRTHLHSRNLVRDQHLG